VKVIALILLLLIPVLSYRWANKKKPAAKLTVLGISWGSVASPVSMGLYSTVKKANIGSQNRCFFS
jgi:phosphoglycerol transferase MdoB-like AlkP superfamily enzyme